MMSPTGQNVPGCSQAGRSARVWGALAVLIPLALYLRTLAPSISTGDSGELVTGAYCLGILHPPGYSLYCLLGRLFTLLPMGGVARRLNFFSSLSAAACAGLIFVLVRGVLIQGSRPAAGRRLTGWRSSAPRSPDRSPDGRSPGRGPWIEGAALLAALACAFSRTLWTQAVVAEVYALNLLLLLLSTAALLWWSQSGERRYLLLFAFIYGLSLSHHPVALLAAPAFGTFLVWHRRRLFERRTDPVLMAVLLLLGLTPQLYLLFRALARPPLDWGHPADAVSLLGHVTRASYGSLSKHPRSLALLGRQLLAWFELLGRQLGSVWTLLSLLGLIVLWRRMRDWALFTLVFFLSTGLGVIGLLNFQVTARQLYLVRVFFIPSFGVMVLWLGLGAGWAADRLMAAAGSGRRRPARLPGWILGCLMPLLAIFPARRHAAVADHSDAWSAARLGRDILATMEPGAILFTGRDTPTFAVAHGRIVEGLRPDVSLKHTGSGDIFRWLMPPPVPVDPWRRPLYGTLPGELPEISGWSPEAAGLLYQLRREPLETGKLLRIWEGYSRESPERRHGGEDFLLAELYRNRMAARGNLARELIARGELGAALDQARRAVRMDSLVHGPDLSMASSWARLYNDLGLALKAAGRDRQAAGIYHRAVELDGRFAAPLRNLGVLLAYRMDRPFGAVAVWEQYLRLRPDDPDTAAIRAEIERLRETAKVTEEPDIEEDTTRGEGDR
jgi:tetratricopeptide (TPR) repeat protein